ncbi:MAG: bifunctional (p)ppGpp synthetase/guanosine-3',5'-bis(diphosphate) 3'-pyrophosphohydrolase [Anaerolineales bacterium]|nr:bifunctional (p)ppGpp synthetase/guanosine-3',5'-bis(diphosphate) 3'-pyrophosphohydrolase [Anaerolineales bacterium]
MKQAQTALADVLRAMNHGSQNAEARARVERAYQLAAAAHGEQRRKSGDPYIQHPLAVARLLAEIGMDVDTIVAGLLHDLVEDTDVSLDQLSQEFGPEVAALVDGVTKLKIIDHLTQRSIEEERSEQEAESLRKMFIAMAEDTRVVMIKLADRLHNMSTLEALTTERQREYAREALEIFAPLANRLGIWQWKWELEDLCLRHIDLDSYRRIASQIKERRAVREASIERSIAALRARLTAEGIEAEISGRAKHIYSIYQKMLRKGIRFDQVFDVRAIRVITDTVPNCYRVLGIVHGLWKPIPGEFDDYIASPKDNGYQSLHTAVIGEDGRTLEVQIRTAEMHYIAEYGIAAHWRYKEGITKRDEAFEAKIAWLRVLMDWRQELTNAGEFMDAMKTDIFQDRVYVFTPKGKIIDLPVGSTPIDFAYHIHTEIGHRCRGAKVNDQWRRLDYQLRTGERVEIITGKRPAPSRDWLNPALGYAKTTRAQAKIRQWFRRQDRDQNIAQGWDIVERELKRLGLEQISHETLAKWFGIDKVEDFHAAVGFGDIHTAQISSKIGQMRAEEQKEQEILTDRYLLPTATTVEGIQVQGTGGLLTRLANCCHPLPGDSIVGYVTRGKGVTIHRRDCPNMLRKVDQDRLIEVDWGPKTETAPATIAITAYDRTGLLHDISGIISAERINIDGSAVDVDRQSNISTMYITVEVSDIAQLSRLLTRIEQLPNVIEARRRTRVGK